MVLGKEQTRLFGKLTKAERKRIERAIATRARLLADTSWLEKDDN